MRYSTFLLYFGAASLSKGEDSYYESEKNAYGRILDDGKLMDIATQCIDAQGMPYYLNRLDNYCTDTQASKFELALVDYNSCTSTDFSALVETFWDALLGVSLMCAPYYYKVSNVVEQSYYFNDYDDDHAISKILEFLKQPMPHECLYSLLGDNAFGDFIRQHTISPGKERECLATLGRQVPDCTLRRWPVPIPGFFLKAYSCMENKFLELDPCKVEMEALKCLPTVNEIKESNSDALCQEWTKVCTHDRILVFKTPSITLLLPPPLSAHPLSDICKDTDISNGVSARLEAYQHKCLSDEYRKIWSQGTHGVPNVPITLKMARQKKNNGKSSSSSGFGAFMFGLIIGIACTALLSIFNKRRNGAPGHYGGAFEQERLETGVQLS